MTLANSSARAADCAGRNFSASNIADLDMDNAFALFNHTVAR